MISFETGAGRFNYGVAGVALTANRVLLHRREGDDFWTLPGGRPSRPWSRLAPHCAARCEKSWAFT